jgi:hypothetical protein
VFKLQLEETREESKEGGKLELSRNDKAAE